MVSDVALAEIAYDAYCKSGGFCDADSFKSLSHTAKSRWLAAARAVKKTMVDSQKID